MKFTPSSLIFLALGSLGLVAATPVEMKAEILARAPITDPCPPHLICVSEPSEARAPIVDPCPPHLICGKAA
ncbi:hypothetical protein B0H19DRAFT_1265863 [Mycena capillaripes]|nr:hypothetical protein B0H19DRAFT_1265863 [Mycena capillaripes]